MKQLTALNIKCLENMPIMLDAISNTVNKLKDFFNPLYDDLKKFTEETIPNKSYTLSESYEKGAIYAFGNEVKGEHLSELKPELHLLYSLSVVALGNKIKHSFYIEFGYIADGEQHVLYFQLFEHPEIKVLSQPIRDIIKQVISEKWTYGEMEDSIEIQFDMDKDVSEEKINDCYQAFRKHILKPVFAQLE
jgi:hypothetical protein